MLSHGPAAKVTIHLNDDTTAEHDFLYNEILSVLLGQGVAGATVIRPEAGFGAHRRLHLHGAGIDGGGHMPLRIEFVEARQVVDALLPRLSALVIDGMIEVQDTTVVAIGTRNA